MADTKHIISCPACGCEMKKILLNDAAINVDVCIDGCGGLYFDNRELEKFDESSENIDAIVEELKGKSFKAVDEKEVRICPVCDVPMVKMGSGISGVQIDVCNTCGAKFLDNGELEKIRTGKAANNEKLDELMNELYLKEAKNILGKNMGKKPVTKNFRVAIEKIIFDRLTK